MRLVVAAAATVLTLTACTWVPITPEAQKVRVLRAAPQGCERVGEIEVEVTDKVSLYHRNAIKVTEELETLARNKAVSIPATDIQPVSEPVEGVQRFTAWRCPR
ncbi:hypothetical protein CO614_09295 [Lysobacteraceae bacterium NML120232]|nr:hypothetical protein CO608_09595 [Xanthomonadaceae bacterium NML08-0793]PJK09800.1 hypothetical protein CO614_09295 [Xanthomonadaceae bacterium NML120232]